MALFSVPISAVAVSAAQNLWHIKAGATYGFWLHGFTLDQKTLTSVEGKEIDIVRHTVTVTQGSGGSAPTPTLLSPGSASSGVTAHINDTSRASAGTRTIVKSMVWQFLNGLFYLPPPEQRIWIAPATGLIIDLPTGPSGSMTVSGHLVYEEVGL
ncbi:MAG: hypothetical protein U1E23_14765 [Reyranellaceae bacterium]